MEALEIVNRDIIPALETVGQGFEKKTMYLPQLLMSAEAAQSAFEQIKAQLKTNASDSVSKGRVVIATVQGDIHDIGKNLVAMMLKNYGFEVIDLGKDVPRETIIREAKAHDAKIIALSALMTTTMQEMREVVRYARQEGVNAYVMIGGAVITQEYADEIGAEGYSKDAAEAVRLAQRLLHLL